LARGIFLRKLVLRVACARDAGHGVEFDSASASTRKA